jgi:hypothetical protein
MTDNVPSIGPDPVRVELVADVRQDTGRKAIPAGTYGRAHRLFPESDLAVFAAGRGVRAVVPLAYLRILADESTASHAPQADTVAHSDSTVGGTP